MLAMPVGAVPRSCLHSKRCTRTSILLTRCKLQPSKVVLSIMLFVCENPSNIVESNCFRFPMHGSVCGDGMSASRGREVCWEETRSVDSGI